LSAAVDVALPETEQELRAFLREASVGLIWVAGDGRILWANQTALDLVGYSEADYVGRPFSRFLVAPESTFDLVGRISRGERILAHEAEIRTRDGTPRRVLLDGSGLHRQGRLVHQRLFIRDITGFMAKEQAARHRVEATSLLKDEFLALLSHELRTPLGAILVWLGLLRQGGFDPAESARALEIIERGARSLERIVEDLLHASRIAAGGLALDLQLVDLRSVVQVGVDEAAADAAQKGLTLVSGEEGPAHWVKGDSGRLQQALSNLLSNAVKFTPAGGEIRVSLDTLQGKARITVADTGEGMSPTFLPSAFEKFQQQDRTSTRAHHGLGLGLYVVRHVIGHHGGLVSAQSPGPGRGSTFTILLPLVGHPVAPAIAADAGPPGALRDDRPRYGITVLLVDDEDDVREALRLVLQQNGMAVITAASAQEAFELVGRLRPDVLLSDIAMPGEDGLSLIRRVRLLPPEGGGRIPAAALSAYAAAADRRSALLAGFQHHIAKPIDPARLLEVIAAMAPTHAARRPRAEGSLPLTEVRP
jgi:PAS domain S-box-containing protein